MNKNDDEDEWKSKFDKKKKSSPWGDDDNK
jgi:hypothetical protein